MKKSLLDNLWEYEIKKCEGIGPQSYGYELKIYKNNVCIYKQNGFGSLSSAQVFARDYFLMYEFNMERDID
jgi:hypothetical protein